MSDISLLLLYLVLASLYLCSFCGIQFRVQFLIICFFFGHCYCSLGGCVGFLVCTVPFFALIFPVCFERLFFGGDARRVSSFPHRLSFSSLCSFPAGLSLSRHYAPFPLVCHNFYLAVDTNISCISFQSGSSPISSILLVNGPS